MKKAHWNASRGDNIAVASQAGINSARAAGYTFIRTEGWVGVWLV